MRNVVRKQKMKFKTDYRKLNATIFLGLILLSFAMVAFNKLDGSGKLVWTTFLLLSGGTFLAMGLFVKSKVRLTDELLEITNIAGLGTKRIHLKDIKRIKTIEKDLPVSASNNPLMLILWDKKFKRIKKLELSDDKGVISTIDGHFIEDKDFESLKKKLK